MSLVCEPLTPPQSNKITLFPIVGYTHYYQMEPVLPQAQISGPAVAIGAFQRPKDSFYWASQFGENAITH